MANLDPSDLYRILTDGGLRKVQEVGGSLMVSLPEKDAGDFDVEKQDELMVIRSDDDDTLWEIKQPPEQ